MNMDLWTLVAIFGVIGAAFALYLLRGLPPKHRH
nr:MAG TPA: Growth hormone receptor, GHR, Growth hormone receptor [Caudoviricetes sp.]